MPETEKPLSAATEQRLYKKILPCQNILSEDSGQERNSIQKDAFHLLSLGFSVLPANRDKTPAISWKQYQEKCMSEDTASEVFRNECSLALICGTVSGNLECIDFDHPELYPSFI